jgi:hypothetical protein
MAALADAMAYILKRYSGSAMSNVRLTRMLYLTDWVHALRHRDSVTPIRWYYDTYGPFVWDVLDTANADPERFVVTYTNPAYGAPVALIGLAEAALEQPDLSPEERESADHVIDATDDLDTDGFVKLVYSTHPILTSDRFSYLDLIEKAEEYQPDGAHA